MCGSAGAAFVFLVVSCCAARAQEADHRFLDLEGNRRSVAHSYDRMFGPAAGTPKYARAAGETVLLLGIGWIWYAAKPGANSADWDFTDFSDKIDPSAIRFDNNRFTTNMLLHPIAGSGYYGLARANSLSIPASLGYAFAASTIWEYLLEWREKVSINDMIMTPIGGMVLGECFVKLVEYVSSGPPRGTTARQAFRYTLGFPHALHDQLDEVPPHGDHMPSDALGFSSEYAHDFRLGYEFAHGADDHDNSGIQHVLTAQTEIIALPGYLRPGKFQQVFAHGNFTEMSLRMGFSSRGLVDSDVWLRAAFLGYYVQDLVRTDVTDLRGHAYALSLASAFTHTQGRFLDSPDETGILHMAGPAIEGWLTRSGLWFRGRIEGSLDFAGLRPAALQSFRERNPEGTIKSVLETFGYDYYFGLSLRAQVLLTYRALELGQRVSYGVYDSVAGFDRFEERISRSAESTEQIAGYRAWLGAHVRPFQLQLRFDTRIRTGTLEGQRSGRQEHLAGLGLQLRF